MLKPKDINIKEEYGFSLKDAILLFEECMENQVKFFQTYTDMPQNHIELALIMAHTRTLDKIQENKKEDDN